MIVTNRRAFSIGLFMFGVFVAVLVLMFTPFMNGRTPLEAADELFNSVSKHSSYYIPELRGLAEASRGSPLDATLTLEDAQTAAWAATVLERGGARASVRGTRVEVNGDLGRVLGAALDEAELGFRNAGGVTGGEPGAGTREALFAWWKALKQVDRHLRDTKQFASAARVEQVIGKGVEVSYNFYGISPSPAAANAWVLALALLSYLVYTIWWGYAVMWLCDGIGLQMTAASKREH